MERARSNRAGWGRRLRWGLGGLVVLVAVLVVGVLIALRSEGVRRSILDRVQATVLEQSGWEVRVRDFDLRFAPLTAVLEGVEAGSPGEPPWAVAERVEVAPRWSTLLGRDLHLSRLVLGGVVVDLERPFPASPEDPEEKPADTAFAIELDEFRLEESAVRGNALPEGVQAWVRDWWVEDVRVEGGVTAGVLDLRLAAAPSWRRADGPEVGTTLRAELDGPLEGPWELAELEWRGEGLDLHAAGVLGTGERLPFGGGFELSVEPHRLIPVPAASGAIEIVGEAFATAGTARIDVRAPGLPSELALPWIDVEPEMEARLVGGRVDLDASLTAQRAETWGISGQARIRADQGGRTLIVAEVDLPEALDAGEALGFSVRADLFPGLEGTRKVSGTVVLPGSAPSAATAEEEDRIVEGRLVDGRLDIEMREVSRLVRTLEEFVPGGLPAEVGGYARGGIDLAARFEGPWTALNATAQATWALAPGSRVRLDADLDPGFTEGTADLSLTAVRLTQFDPSLAGTIGGTAGIEWGKGSYRWRADLDGTGIEGGLSVGGSEPTGVAGPAIDRISVVATGDTRRVDLRSLVAEVGGRAVSLEGGAGLAPSRPGSTLRIESAELRGFGTGLLTNLDRADLTLDLRDGVVEGSVRSDLRGRAGAEPGSSEGAEGRIEFLVPIGALAAVPELRETVAALPMATSEGPVTIEWDLPAAEWIPLLTELGAAVPFGRLELASRGRVTTELREPLVGQAQIAVDVVAVQAEGDADSTPVWEGDAVALDGRWGDGRFRIASRVLQVAGIEGALEVEGPIAAVTSLAETPAGTAPGPISVRWRVAETDWLPLLARLGVEEPPDRLRLGSSGSVDVDPAFPGRSAGTLEIDGFSALLDGRTVEASVPIRLGLEPGSLGIESLAVTADGQALSADGRIGLDRDWSPGAESGQLLREVDLRVDGVLAAALLNPFLGGGAAEGLLLIDAKLEGTVANLQGRVRVTGPEASILFVSPYVIRLQEPDLEIALVDGVAQIRRGRMTANGGELVLGGTLGPAGVDMTVGIDKLRARLDYGLLALIDGDLRLEMAPEGGGLLSGRLTVDQASLTRPLAVDRELLTSLLVPIDLTGSEESPLEAIELDLRVETRRGVRIDNNVADLSARWQPIEVRGNLLLPVLDGQVDIVPGGRVFLFGQTVRIDSGALVYTGRAGEEAELELETTSSIEDPSIARLDGEDPLAPTVIAGDSTDRGAAVATGVATFYGERLASRLGSGATAITFRAVPIFGETDPGARLTVSRDFSRQVTLAASVDLRNAERQTYLLEAHDLPGLPSLKTQVFTTDTASEGATLQQRLTFGGHRVAAPDGPRVRRLLAEAPPGVSGRRFRRALAFEKGDPVTPAALFAAEVEAGEFLRRAGYPDARVELVTEPVPEREDRVDLRLAVVPGPRATFRFEGTQLTRTLRNSVVALYRSDFYEPFALEEMRAQTVRALRSVGYLTPQVEVEVEAELPTEGGGEVRHVTVRSDGGRKIDLEEVRVEGLPDAEAELVLEGLRTAVQKVELAAGEPDADRRLLATVRRLGYAEPQLVGRELSDDGESLVVRIEPGEPVRLVSVDVTGVPVAESERLAGVVGLAPGDVASGAAVSAGVLAIEEDLQKLGYAEADVRGYLIDTNDALRKNLTYAVETGPRYELGRVVFTGMEATRPGWAESVAGLGAGAAVDPDALSAAERRLIETGLFSSIDSWIEVGSEGRADVLFEVEERPRYSVAYGVRWDSDEGVGGVVDLADDNFLGRNLGLGLRYLHASDDQRARLNAVVPRLFGTEAQLDLFASVRNRIEDGFEEDILQTSAQIGYPVARDLLGRAYVRYSETHLVELDPFDPDFAIDTRIKNPLVGLQLVYDSRDDEPVMPEGWLATVDLSAADDFLGADQRFLRLLGQANWYRRLGHWGSRRLALAQSGRLGLADSFDQELFRDNRFFAGGEYTVRGYPRESLGPQEDLGLFLRPAGGKALAVFNSEFRMDLFEPVVGVAFLDLGNVWERPGEMDLDLAKSIGVGLRAVTPVGLLRVDFAVPLDRREGDPGSQVYFGFGGSF